MAAPPTPSWSSSLPRRIRRPKQRPRGEEDASPVETRGPQRGESHCILDGGEHGEERREASLERASRSRAGRRRSHDAPARAVLASRPTTSRRRPPEPGQPSTRGRRRRARRYSMRDAPARAALAPGQPSPRSTRRRARRCPVRDTPSRAALPPRPAAPPAAPMAHACLSRDRRRRRSTRPAEPPARGEHLPDLNWIERKPASSRPEQGPTSPSAWARGRRRRREGGSVWGRRVAREEAASREGASRGGGGVIDWRDWVGTVRGRSRSRKRRTRRDTRD